MTTTPLDSDTTNYLMRGILLRDIVTQWGIYAAGLDVLVLEIDGDHAIVCMSNLKGRQLTARIPKPHIAVREHAMTIKAAS